MDELASDGQEVSGDYEDESLELHCGDKTPLSIPILYFFIFVVGITANIAVIYFIVILKEHLKTVTNIYVLQLAVADFMFLFILPFEAVTLIEGKWVYGVPWCKITESLRMLNYYASIMFLMMMSVDRYLAINHAMNSRAARFRTKRAVAGCSLTVWMLGWLCVIYIMVKANVVNCRCAIEFGPNGPSSTDDTNVGGDDAHQNYSAEYNKDYVLSSGNSSDYDNEIDEGGTIPTFPTNLDDDDFQEYVYNQPIHCSYKKETELSNWIIINFVVAFAVPLLVISVCYLQIILKISKPLSSGTTSQSTNRTRKRITYMVTALVLVFIACWLPYHAFNLARVNNLLITKYTCDLLKQSTLVLAYMNSALNPFFYTFMGTNVKKRWNSAISRTRSFRLSFSGRSQYTQGNNRKARRKSSRISMTGNHRSQEDDMMSHSNVTKHSVVSTHPGQQKSEEEFL